MRSPSQSYKQQRNSGSRAKSKPMLANRELKQGEKPPAKSCSKCKESANYLKLFVKKLGVIEELASGSPEFKMVNKNNFAACTLAELGQLLDLTTKLIQAGTNKMPGTPQSTEVTEENTLPVLELPCRPEPEEHKPSGLLTPQTSPTITPLSANPAESEGKRSREEDAADKADEEKGQKKIKPYISNVITSEPANINNDVNGSTPSPLKEFQTDQIRHDSGCSVGSNTQYTQNDSKHCDTNDDNPAFECPNNITVESNFAEETSLKSTG